MSKKALGTLLVSISASAFGTYSYFALLGTKAGLGPTSLLFLRFLIAASVLAIVCLAARPAFPAPGKLLQLAGLGLLYVGQSYCYIKCLLSSNPITASLLFYLYPAFVTIGSVMFLKEKLTPVKLAALLCAFLGSLLIVGGVTEIAGISVLYGMGSAIMYSAYLIVGKKLVRGVPPLASILIVFTSVTLAYGLACIFTGLDLPRSGVDWIGPVGLAVVATVIAIGFLIWGLDMITPVETSALSALEPLVTAIIAVTVLGQALRAGHVAGGVLVIMAVLVLARQATQPEGTGHKPQTTSDKPHL